MKMEQARARRDEIIRRSATETGPEIADSLGISRQRVQQILSNRKSARNIYTPERTRLERKAVRHCYSCLTDTPKSVFIRVREQGWSICFTPHAEARQVGVFTSAIPWDDFMDQAEFVAEEMGRELYQRRIAA